MNHFADILHANQPSPEVAFDSAIADGRLSADEAQPHWAGHYMFMGRAKSGELMFKHRDTRQYLSPRGWAIAG